MRLILPLLFRLLTVSVDVRLAFSRIISLHPYLANQSVPCDVIKPNASFVQFRKLRIKYMDKLNKIDLYTYNDTWYNWYLPVGRSPTIVLIFTFRLVLSLDWINSRLQKYFERYGPPSSPYFEAHASKQTQTYTYTYPNKEIKCTLL